MNFAPIPPALPLWLLLTLPLLVALLLVLWVTRRDRKTAAYRKATGDMLLEQLQQANATVSAVVKAEQDAIHSVVVLPETVEPLEAERVLRAAMKDSSIYDRQALMLHAWEVLKYPQALAALAGIALHDLENTPNIARAMFWRVLKEAGPALLEQVASALDEHPQRLDSWLDTGGLIVSLERSADRVEREAPQVAAHLLATALRLEPRCRDRMLRDLRFQIETREEDETISPEKMAGDLAAYCLPRFPELGATVHAALDRHDGPEWERAHIWFDKAVLHRFYDQADTLDHFDFDAALGRLCAGLIAADAETSRFAAEQAADLLSDYFYNRQEYRARLRQALDVAVTMHSFTSSHDWLAKELDPPAVAAEYLDASAFDLTLVRDGMTALGEATATLDPAVALVELRVILPNVPVTTLRDALIAQWREKPSSVWLAALAGLGLEELGGNDPDIRLVHTLFFHPLQDGSPELVKTIAGEAEKLMAGGAGDARFGRLHEVIAVALARVEA